MVEKRTDFEMADKIELDLVSNLSETNSITASVSTFGTVDSTINLFRRDSIEISSTAPRTGRCSCKSKCCSKTLLLIFIHMIIMVTSVAAVALSVLTATYYFNMMNERESEMQSLMERITALENVTSTSQTVNGTEVEPQQFLTDIANQVEANRASLQLLNEDLNTDYAQRVNQVREMLLQISHDLQVNVSNLTMDVNNNQGSIRALSRHFTLLDGKVQKVQEDIFAAANTSSTSTNPFENCIVSQEMCSGSVMSNIYYRVCGTPFISLNVTVSYIPLRIMYTVFSIETGC